MDVARLLLNLFFLLLLSYLYRILKNSIRQTGYLEFYSLIWGLFIIGAQLLGPPYQPTLYTTFIFYTAWLCFLLPSFGIYSGKNEDQPLKNTRPDELILTRGRRYFRALVMLSLLANVWMIYRISGDLNILRFGLVALRFQGQRLLTEQSTIFFQLFARDYTIYLPLGIWLYRHRAIHAGSLSVVVFIAFTTAATTLTRGPILLCSMSLITAILTFFRPNRWQAVGFALGLVALLGSLTLLLVPDVDALLTISTTYFWGSCPAYERILDGRFPDTAWYDIPLYSLDSLNYALSKFGLIRTYPTLVRPYAPGALTTNVYTYLDAPTLDFGVLGAMVGAAMVGGLAAWLHRKAHRHQSPLVVAYYGFINYAITISFMNNELIRIHAFLLALELWGLQQLITAKTQPLPGSPTNE